MIEKNCFRIQKVYFLIKRLLKIEMEEVSNVIKMIGLTTGRKRVTDVGFLTFNSFIQLVDVMIILVLLGSRLRLFVL